MKILYKICAIFLGSIIVPMLGILGIQCCVHGDAALIGIIFF